MASASDYMDNVKKYDPKASEDDVQKVVNYCGIALRSKDASLVSCSDEAERNRVRDGYAAKKLGMSAAAADKAIEAVCQQMKDERQKSRVTFLYLLGKHA
ncbi:DUF2853 family protein [Litorimonas sp. RW-G-Af-16]|uniref:DUF2853 family protein n=1 Tax=Litorimonas sp. RW-G-Af-16 TaxID=3241168 RepID=UPI00390C6B1E